MKKQTREREGCFKNVFGVICYYQSDITRRAIHKPVYEQVYHDGSYSTQITAEQAEELIKKHNLTLVVDNAQGRIWDVL